MRGQLIGSAIAAVFGVVYVLLNSGELEPPVRWGLRIVAILAALGVLFLVVRGFRRSGMDPGRSGPAGASPFGRSYWLIVAAEAVLLFGGVRILAGPLERPSAGVAWVSVVVGVHFFPLGRLFRQPFFYALGAMIAACGAAGVILAFADADRVVVDVVAGVLPGLILLAFGGWGALRADRDIRR